MAFYARQGDHLTLAAAAGPPVCNTLPIGSEVGSHGMCVDALLLNSTIHANDVSRYRGYVSCDGESGLQTVASLVCPIRNASGTPLGVWDVDSTQPLVESDVIFFDRFFAAIGAFLSPTTLLEVTDVDETPKPPSKSLKGEDIRLAQFLKWKGIVGTGGAAKQLIQDGQVNVNGEVEKRRGRRLRGGDVIEVEGSSLTVD